MTAQTESPWWDDPDFDWTLSDPGRLLDLLISAYPTRAAIASVTQAAELDFPLEPDATAPAQAIWKRVLKQAAMKRRFPALMEKVLADQSGKESRPLIVSLWNRLLASPVEPDDEPIDGLQAVTSAGAGLGDAVACVQAFLNLIWRTAVIRIEGQESGTGFLVGGNLILTAAHVVDAVRHLPARSRAIAAVFDFNSEPRHSHAEIGNSVPVDGVICTSPPTQGERGRIKGQDWEAPPESLDFALLQLAFPPPRVRMDGQYIERGYYILDPDSYRFERGSPLVIAQYPLQDFLKFSYITQSPVLNRASTRIRYLGNTLRGSSGGPIVDTRGRLVALHHYSTSRENHGVPISAIAQKLKNGPYAELFDGTEWENLAHLGTYSAEAKDKVCQGIADGWQKVALELMVSAPISDSYGLWNWLSSQRTLYKLRGALLRLGYTELAHILDYDLTKVNRPRISRINDQASRLTQSMGRATAALGPGSLLASTTRARHLASKLRKEIKSLPALQNHPLLALQWRMNWSAEFERAEAALDELANMLPANSAEACQAVNSVEEMIEYAQEVGSAIAALGELAQSPALSL